MKKDLNIYICFTKPYDLITDKVISVGLSKYYYIKYFIYLFLTIYKFAGFKNASYYLPAILFSVNNELPSKSVHVFT